MSRLWTAPIALLSWIGLVAIALAMLAIGSGKLVVAGIGGISADSTLASLKKNMTVDQLRDYGAARGFDVKVS